MAPARLASPSSWQIIRQLHGITHLNCGRDPGLTMWGSGHPKPSEGISM